MRVFFQEKKTKSNNNNRGVYSMSIATLHLWGNSISMV